MWVSCFYALAVCLILLHEYARRPVISYHNPPGRCHSLTLFLMLSFSPLQASSIVPHWADQKMPAYTQRCTSSSPPCILTFIWTRLTAPRRLLRQREAKCQSCGEWKETSLAYFKIIFLPSWSYFLMSWLSLHPGVYSARDIYFSW